METRRFGRSGHMSTIAILGCAAFGKVDQATADQAMKEIMDHGVNHIDIAPSYGNAEERLAPWMKNHRDDFFLGCKTMERTAEGAKNELENSLRILGVEYFDLYQLHAVKTLGDLDDATKPGGALDAILKAQSQGKVRFIGITGHGVYAPSVFIEALKRFDFDSVLFPVNFVQFTDERYKNAAESLLQKCMQDDIGVMLIKSICKGPWGERQPMYDTWYEPFTDTKNIQNAINFALSQAATGICTAGDTRLLPKVLNACEHFNQMSEAEVEEMVMEGKNFHPLFTY